MRIAISGAQSTGKTTLAHRLVEALGNARVEPEPFRVLRERLLLVSGPHSMTPQQELELIRHNQNRLRALRGQETVIYDRCSLDALAHALVARRLGNPAFDEDWMDTLRREADRALDVIDLLVIVRVEDGQPLVPDGVRSEDESYRRMVDEEIAGLAADREHAMEVRGDTEERVSLLREKIERMRSGA